MRTAIVLMSLMAVTAPALAQRRPSRPIRADSAEAAIKQAAEQLAADKKIIERDLEVLRHLRIADAALADDMQRAAAIQKAFEAVAKAKSLGADFLVMQEIIRAERELESARRSPGTTDFGHLRNTVRAGMGTASRVVVRNALRLEEETLSWLKIQQMIADHVRSLSEVTGDSLRAAEQ